MLPTKSHGERRLLVETGRATASLMRVERARPVAPYSDATARSAAAEEAHSDANARSAAAEEGSVIPMTGILDVGLHR